MCRSLKPVIFLFALVLTAQLNMTPSAWAHGSGWSQGKAFSVVLSFYYADQTPMAYSEVQIFSPTETKIPHQKGRSDRNGFFVFRPDAPGAWTFSAADGQGHLSQGEIEVTAGQLNPDAGSSGAAPAASPEAAQPEPQLAKGGASAEGPDPLKIILGISLIVNLGLIFMWRKALRSKENRPAAQ